MIRVAEKAGGLISKLNGLLEERGILVDLNQDMRSQTQDTLEELQDWG